MKIPTIIHIHCKNDQYHFQVVIAYDVCENQNEFQRQGLRLNNTYVSSILSNFSIWNRNVVILVSEFANLERSWKG